MIKFLKKQFGQKPPVIDDPFPEERQPETKPPKADDTEENDTSWIGVDLDGTLARIIPWKGPESIGEPVPLMFERVKHWLEQGITVKIFTARASKPECIPPVKAWLEKHGLPDLEITNVKDFDMLELWDDRAIQVVQDTGRPFLSPSIVMRPRSPILPDEVANGTFYVLPNFMTNPPPNEDE